MEFLPDFEPKTERWREAYSATLRFMPPSKSTYLWQAPDWPRLRIDLAAVNPSLALARTAQGTLFGLLASLNLPDRTDIQIEGWVKEAQSSASIEGEVLQLNSVRASVARRLGLSPSPNRQDGATEGMLDILQSAPLHAQDGKRINDELLYSWHAALR
jgi:Fic family protein